MKIAIVDDQIEYREQIKELLNASDKDLEIECFENGEELLLAKINEFAIIFLDIEMKEMNGVEVGRQLELKKCKAIKFYITSYTCYISDALRNQTFQYMLKPINEKLFFSELNRAMEQIKISKMEIKIQWKKDIGNIAISEINYVESYNRSILIHMVDNKIEKSSERLEKIFEKLKTYNFEHTSKSYFVNLKEVRKIEGNTVFMKNNETVFLSKKYRPDFKRSFTFYLNEVTL